MRLLNLCKRNSEGWKCTFYFCNFVFKFVIKQSSFINSLSSPTVISVYNHNILD